MQEALQGWDGGVEVEVDFAEPFSSKKAGRSAFKISVADLKFVDDLAVLKMKSSTPDAMWQCCCRGLPDKKAPWIFLGGPGSARYKTPGADYLDGICSSKFLGFCSERVKAKTSTGYLGDGRLGEMYIVPAGSSCSTCLPESMYAYVDENTPEKPAWCEGSYVTIEGTATSVSVKK
uniref:Uncharacterized protein n=1 Tax=Chromera velia CCMP2878 TaxID=1169474 RepID=A0A0G4FR56_9ALVE|eukprot:Cvel_18324.t1-p1 / transcript=Cvel_18324.t1 / gene=Cvel_18324 / organism=Chromera_velia_CCMP2878 / gene_product=hypothetical protein / transcript_product=hypothetical protein / location=Cvel_scaffold1512:25177-29372(-) / protein_length=175 / sequence_SO=supercontig / SO=protein_coding / is_pseudo=false